jgi:hypothetical protein
VVQLVTIVAVANIIVTIITAMACLPAITQPVEPQLPELDRLNVVQEHIVVVVAHILARLVIPDLLMEILPAPVMVVASLVGIVQPVAPVTIKIFVLVQQLQIVMLLRPLVVILVQREHIMLIVLAILRD